ncbi:F0F1 ATP synthase subunit gamma [Thiofaba sp. EF100]|jgi:F-type H+-transporting ATPase subunit gamma|uniref:F0F1 ATP synthase subunit gamma n=1 Tax=Thiofaba sp. EF100 TaxID=3121274 RepID=UPI003221FF18
MAGAKEIRTQIKSVQNTRKITKAMEMVAASKMRKAQENMEATRPYLKKVKEVIANLSNAHPEYRHPFMVERPVKRVGMILVTTDRGLCGGLNVNLFRQALKTMKGWADQNIEIDVCAIGSKGVAFVKRGAFNPVAEITGLGDRPKFVRVQGAVKVMLDAFEAGNLDEIWIARNDFVNSMTQRPVIERILPLMPVDLPELQHRWDYIYEPESKDVLDLLLKRYVAASVHQATIENVACEMSARRIAMKNASDNAGGLIRDLKLKYNKARQAAITQEIAEIVGGAAAVG